MDTATGDVRAVEFISSREGDSPVLPDLLDQIPTDEQIGTVTGDGAFDTRRCHTAIVNRGSTAVIPIRKSGRLWKEDCPAARARNDMRRRANASAGRLEALGWPSRAKSDRGEDALPQILLRTDCLARPRQTSGRDPHPRCAHEPLRRAKRVA